MGNLICKKVTAMISAYIENKLSSDEKQFVENHFAKCPSCRKKFYEMSAIISNLHFEYEKLLNEFEKIEENKTFNIKEYEEFHNNISPYIDDELCYEDSLKFRRYILKSKPAREELSHAYRLRNNIRKSANDFMDKNNINYSKRIINKIKENDKYLFPNIYKRAIIAFAFMISVILAFVIFIGVNFFSHSYAQTIPETTVQKIIFPDDADWVEFFFDNEGNCLLADK